MQCKLLFNRNGSLIFLSFPVLKDVPVLKDDFYYWISLIHLLVELLTVNSTGEEDFNRFLEKKQAVAHQ